MPRSRLSTTFPSTPPPVPTTFTDGLPLPPVLVFDLDYTLWPFWVDTHCTGPLKPASSATNNRHNEKQPAPEPYNKSMIDRYGEHFSFYDQVPTVLAAGRARGLTMSVASRTHAPDMAKEMLRGLYVPPLPSPTSTAPVDGEPTTTTPQQQQEQQQSTSLLDTTQQAQPLRGWDFFSHPQMYPGTKTAHLTRIQAALRKQGRDVPFEDMVFFDDEARNRNVERDLGAVFVLVPDGLTAHEVDRGIAEWRRRRGILAPSSRRDSAQQQQQQQQQQQAL